MKIDNSLFAKIVLALVFGWMIYHLYINVCSCKIEGLHPGENYIGDFYDTTKIPVPPASRPIIFTNDTLKQAVNQWLIEPVHKRTYGHIKDWDVSKVTDMSNLFYKDPRNYGIGDWYINGVQHFNEDISKWDVSNVTNMHRMFANCSDFDQDISGWDVSNVTDMTIIFDGRSFIYYSHNLCPWKEKLQQNVWNQLVQSARQLVYYISPTHPPALPAFVDCDPHPPPPPLI